MNLLAHAHLAHLAKSSIFGNLIADFIKGNPYDKLPVEIADGVLFHRQIDMYVDQSTHVHQAKQLFKKENQRFCGIALDILWNHFLANAWLSQKNSDLFKLDFMVLSEFNHNIALLLEQYQQHIPINAVEFFEHMSQQNWLIRYSEIEFVKNVLNGMVKRRPKLAQQNACFDDIIDSYAELNKLFNHLYPALLGKFVV